MREEEYGPWRISDAGGVTSLDYVAAPYHLEAPYWIASDRVDTAEKVLDWVAHLAEKNWASPEVLGWFLRAAMKLSPQAFVRGKA